MLPVGGGCPYPYETDFSTLSQARFESAPLTYLAIDAHALVTRLACQLATKGVIMVRPTTLSVQVSLTATAGSESSLRRRSV
jgi:hypothetical protein